MALPTSSYHGTSSAESPRTAAVSTGEVEGVDMVSATVTRCAPRAKSSDAV